MYTALRCRAKLVQGVDVKVQELCYSYGNIDNLSFSLNKGERLMVLGENGAGKTTLLRLIAGFYKPKSGSILIDGLPPQKVPQFTIGYIPQNTDNVQFSLSVEEVTGLGVTGHGRQKKQLIKTALERTGALHLIDRSFNSLSGGEKQKVSLARCLAQNAKLLLLDEPTAAMDSENKKMVIDILRSLSVSEIPTIIVVTHDKDLCSLEGWKRLYI